jgi:hypothetical protein
VTNGPERMQPLLADVSHKRGTGGRRSSRHVECKGLVELADAKNSSSHLLNICSVRHCAQYFTRFIYSSLKPGSRCYTTYILQTRKGTEKLNNLSEIT